MFVEKSLIKQFVLELWIKIGDVENTEINLCIILIWLTNSLRWCFAHAH